MRIAAISVVSSITGSFACAPGSCYNGSREGHFPTSLNRLPGLLFGAFSGAGLHLQNKHLTDQLHFWTGASPFSVSFPVRRLPRVRRRAFAGRAVCAGEAPGKGL